MDYIVGAFVILTLLMVAFCVQGSDLRRQIKQLKYERDKLMKISLDQSSEIKGYRKQLGFDDDQDYRDRLDKLMRGTK